MNHIYLPSIYLLTSHNHLPTTLYRLITLPE